MAKWTMTTITATKYQNNNDNVADAGDGKIEDEDKSIDEYRQRIIFLQHVQ